ncbi:GGDEF domain-containing protein [Nocardia terpenica]|uniref:GGDEF domain-containing protein n=1 Tax=Nocardia terpenica TaxID=455432 RepID=A0A291RVC3_9NOCA|nr:diguanylate cyclase [Nocardia terpenica]ATL71182.1 GGDEF domain-containing protein [Nocardia terpenica]
MSESRSILRTWWRDRVDYAWLVGTFESHRALAPLKFMVGAGGLVMLVINLLTMLSPAGPRGIPASTVAWTVAALAVLWTARFWLFSWPGEAESLIWIASADIAITANALADHNRLYGATTTVLLAVTGGYITVMYGPRILALHVGWSLVSILMLAALMVIRHPTEYGIPLASAVVLIMVAATVVVLPPVQFCHWLLRRDALSDPLTMLLNRRGLDYHLSRFFGPSGRGSVFVLTLDLDRFKQVNDTFGHSFGDEVLVRTAERLRSAALPGAIIARSGGEEFVIVGHLHGEAVGAVAERLRSAVESMPGLPIAITASIGAAVFDPTRTNGRHTRGTHQNLLRRSDSAMYRAKQLGGNAVVVAGPTEPDNLTDMPQAPVATRMPQPGPAR